LVGNFATMRVGWTKFYFDDFEALEDYFKAGGVMDDSYMYECINESAIKCLPILIQYGAIIDEDVWNQAIKYDRDDHVVVLLKRGYLPSKIPEVPRNDIWSLVEISVTLCQRSVWQILQIGKLANQPMCYMWKIVARFLHSTRHDLIWLSVLSDDFCT
jgi:hypothetical protein